ncbi:DUF1707 domain-containing protein [Nonomuraea sp. NBC_00507]|uniref:DUF1707 SHOCT-like domain-containing protein n=1 Tax=Nonomuraea sp. NBC_00507 TaxID=2976002 RepID=UPI002E17D97B
MSDPEITRASEIDRDAVVERLRAASAEGLLTPEELNTRTEAAYASQTPGELAEVIADLPERSSSVTQVQDKRSRRFYTTWAGAGLQRAEGGLLVSPLFGMEVDVSEAIVPADAEQIKVASLFGGIEVIVPEGVSVELTGFTVFGRRKVDVYDGEPADSPPVVRVLAYTFFGSVLVRTVRSSEITSDDD